MPGANHPDLTNLLARVVKLEEELGRTKAEVIWRRTIRWKFAHKTDKALPPVIAPAPLASIPGTLCAPALAAQIIVDKFEDHLPHYRQSIRFRRRYDAHIGRQTINSWNHFAATHLTPIGKAIKSEVLQATELQVDETPIAYLKPGHGSTKPGYLWNYNAGLLRPEPPNCPTARWERHSPTPSINGTSSSSVWKTAGWRSITI